MSRIKDITYFFLISCVAILLYSCESDPVTVESSIINDNLFFVEQFQLIDDQSLVSQNLGSSIGDSYRICAGVSDGLSKTALLKMDLDLFKESKYCEVNPDATLEDSTISELDSIRLILKVFTKLMDNDDLLLIEEDSLRIMTGFSEQNISNLDSLPIYTPSSLEELTSASLSLISNDDEPSSNIEFQQYLIYVKLPFMEEDWCNSNSSSYLISIDYTPNEADDIQYIEFTSMQYELYGITTNRSSLEISYKEITELSTLINIFNIDSINGVSLDGSSDDIYYIYNDTLNTGTILLAKGMNEGFNDLFNSEEISLEDINLYNSSLFEANQEYEIDVNVNINPELDSLSLVQILLDNITIVGNVFDPEQDNYSLDTEEGTESNELFDEDTLNGVFTSEIYKDLGFDYCPDEYEDGMNQCLCDYVINPDTCLELDDINIIYNPSGKEGNGVFDFGETFSESDDCGTDGCFNNREGGLDENGVALCLDSENPDYVEGTDPNGDDYNIDPSNDNWSDCGIDGCCNNREDGEGSCYESVNPDYVEGADPNDDDWGPGKLQGTEGNAKWDYNDLDNDGVFDLGEPHEGTEGNGQWDYQDLDGNGIFTLDDFHESFNDWGIDGIPETEEDNCTFCLDDANTESNNFYDLGEPFQDTGIDGFFSYEENSYNPSGTENNKQHDLGENFSGTNDCGEDGCCNNYEDGLGGCLELENPNHVIDTDPNGDDYNIDPNNDNWKDCGADGDCALDDPEQGQGNQEWDSGEKYEGNGKYDYEQGACNCFENLSTCVGECFYDWGLDQLPDSLEIMSDDQLLTFTTSGIIDYHFDDTVASNNSESDANVQLDIVQINGDFESGSLTIKIRVVSEKDFRAIEFRLSHMPYYHTKVELFPQKDFIQNIDNSPLFEDVSLYDNFLDENFIFSDSALVVDYANSISFSVIFDGLSDFILHNPNIYIHDNNTRLLLNFEHSDSLFNFFDGSVGLIVSQNNYAIELLGSITASANTTVSSNQHSGLSFSPVIEAMIDGDIDPSDHIDFMLNKKYDNNHRLVFNNQSTPPILEVMYTK